MGRAAVKEAEGEQTRPIIIGFANELPPKVAIDQARRGVGTEVRPTREELEEMFKEVDAS